jgi:hypothetical protein
MLMFGTNDKQMHNRTPLQSGGDRKDLEYVTVVHTYNDTTGLAMSGEVTIRDMNVGGETDWGQGLGEKR